MMLIDGYWKVLWLSAIILIIWVVILLKADVIGLKTMKFTMHKTDCTYWN
jgi:hypothetical protein